MHQRITETLRCCPLCSSYRVAAVTVPRRWIGERTFADLRGLIGITRCRECGLAFTNPRPVDERLNAFYNGPTYSCHTLEGSASSGQRAAFILGKLMRHSRRRYGSLLDFGCGSGAFLLSAREAGLNVYGFEPGQRGRECCKQLGIEVSATLNAIPSKAFDFVTLHHVLEHLQDPVGILSYLRGLLSSDGHLFIEVPNVKSLRARLATDSTRRLWVAVDERYRAFPIHLMYYSKTSLVTLLRRAGYEIENVGTAGIGLDEFLYTEVNNRGSNALVISARHNMMWQRIKHLLRDSFLALGLGENLVAIARPAGSPES